MLSKKLYSVILLWAVSKILIYFGFHHLSYEHAEAMFPIKLFLVFTFHQHVDKAVIRTSGVAVCQLATVPRGKAPILLVEPAANELQTCQNRHLHQLQCLLETATGKFSCFPLPKRGTKCLTTFRESWLRTHNPSGRASSFQFKAHPHTKENSVQLCLLFSAQTHVRSTEVL